MGILIKIIIIIIITHTQKLKKIKERLDAGLPQPKRGRKKGVIYDPIEINLMLEKEGLPPN